MTNDWSLLAAAIRARREALRITQRSLAKSAGVTATTIRNIEGGREFRRIPSSLTAIEAALGWEFGSAEKVLAGGEPVLASLGTTGEIPQVAALSSPLPADDEDPIVIALNRLRVSRNTRQALVERYLQEKRAVERQILRAGLEAERTAQGGEYEDGYSNTA